MEYWKIIARADALKIPARKKSELIESDDIIRIEIANMFSKLAPNNWDLLVEKVWFNLQIQKRKWAEHGKWWRKTTKGKNYYEEYSKKRVKHLKTIGFEMRKCLACGKKFKTSLYNIKRKRDKVCSNECRGALRKNITLYEWNGAKRTLSEIANINGLKMATIWARIKRGWDFEKAVSTTTMTRAKCHEQS
jgi:hypothetical protein